MKSKKESGAIQKDPGDEAIFWVETYLNSTLEPISPRQEFVDKLRGRLTLQSDSLFREVSTFEYVFFITAGIVSSILLLVTSIRATMALLEALRYLRKNKQNVSRSKTISVS